MKNIAVLIPVKSKPEYLNQFLKSDLYEYFFKSFFKNYDSEHKYTIYLGYQDNDKLYNNEKQRNIIEKHFNIMKNATVVFKSYEPKWQGNVAGIWTTLCYLAMTDGNENNYFIQCGSDISFVDKGFVNDAINILEKNNNIGVVGLEDRGRLKINPNDRLLTQSIVSWKHFLIFGFYYPQEIINWGCDDWITEIYERENMVYRLKQGFYNLGGKERYEIDFQYKNAIRYCVEKHKTAIKDYLKMSETIKSCCVK
jgi:hypothetical protein